jgi:cytochrome c oxidase subunit 3
VDAQRQQQLIERSQANTSTIGMLIFLASWSMMFAACFYSYAMLRLSGGGWPPDGMPALPIGLPAFNTVVMLTSSLTLYLGLHAVRQGRIRALSRYLVATILLGILFTLLQVLLWRGLLSQGLTHQTGSYGSSFYFLTAFHALHVLVGLILLVSLLPKAVRGGYTAQSHHRIKLFGMFWHFVNLVWIFMFFSVFLF